MHMSMQHITCHRYWSDRLGISKLKLHNHCPKMTFRTQFSHTPPLLLPEKGMPGEGKMILHL